MLCTTIFSLFILKYTINSAIPSNIKEKVLTNKRSHLPLKSFCNIIFIIKKKYMMKNIYYVY